MVGLLLRELGYSLQATAKTVEGAQHEDRNAQFEYINYINGLAGDRLEAGEPVVSVDCKKSAWSGRSRGSHEMLWGPAGRGRRFLIGAV